MVSDAHATVESESLETTPLPEPAPVNRLKMKVALSHCQEYYHEISRALGPDEYEEWAQSRQMLHKIGFAKSKENQNRFEQFLLNITRPQGDVRTLNLAPEVVVSLP